MEADKSHTMLLVESTDTPTPSISQVDTGGLRITTLYGEYAAFGDNVSSGSDSIEQIRYVK